MFKKSKIALFIAIISILSLGGIATVSAEEGTGATVNASANINVNAPRSGEDRKELRDKREDRRDELKDKREDKRNELKDRREEQKEKHRSKIKNRIEREIEKMSTRFNTAIERLEKLITRIESRIEKLKASGKNTAEAEGFVADAKVKIAEAKINIGKLPLVVDSSVNVIVETSTASSTATSTQLRKPFEEVRILTKLIKEELKEAHRLLVKAVVSIKGIGEHRGEDADEDNSGETTTP